LGAANTSGLLGWTPQKPTIQLFISFLPAFAILHICAALDPHTDGIVNAKKKGSASNALTSLAGQTDRPHDAWRCPGY
jgi:hypothetical protein